MPALRRENHQGDHHVKRDQHPYRLAQILHPVARGEELGEGEDEDREVQQKGRIGQVADHLAREPGAVGVVIGQQPEAGVQPPAVLARLQERDVERRQPMAAALQRIGERAAAGNLFEHPPNRLAVRAVGGIAFELFQRPDEAEPRAGELAKLMIEISASRQLAGRDRSPAAGLRRLRGRGWP